MLDKLLDFLKEIWNDLIPVEVVPPYNGGVQLRMGALLRVLEGGKWYWKIRSQITSSLRLVPRTERLTGLATTTMRWKSYRVRRSDHVPHI